MTSRRTRPELEPIDTNSPMQSRIGISYQTAAACAISFLVGVVAALLVKNALSSEQITFSTPSLLGFLFGVALSAASIVLAIAAIALGKISEHSIIRRSDESIRLQNEVFVRTTDALARIESS